MAIQLVLQMMFVLFIIREASAQVKSPAKPRCQQTCGSVTIPYPFGIGTNCSADKTFEINCNNSRPFLRSNNLQVLEISLEAGTIRVNNPVITANCENRTNGLDVNLLAPFTFSDTQNRFTAMGCDNLALITQQDFNIGGCMSFCNVTSRENSCFGINCCQTRIPPSLTFINASLRSIDPNNDQKSCKYAFIVDQNWFGNLTNPYSVQSMEQVPAVLDWRTFWNCSTLGSFPSTNISLYNTSLCGKNAFCSNQRLCSCLKGYEGNPYLPDGCRDIDECATNRCQQICTNTPGSYHCSCMDGWKSLGYSCYNLQKVDDGKRARVAIIATSTSFGVLILLAAALWLYKVIQRRKKAKLKEKFFKRNGGLLLQQQVSSGEGSVEKTKLFTSKELEKATDHYNVDRILGQGGQGTVYKGMLTDGRIVAVKKSKIEDENKLEHFINEVVILSQINHRNIVKLHGCCLETEVPLLVYEFIPNGTLFQYIHNHNDEFFPLSWDVRVRVATEAAGALFYLHSAASIPIYHRDIKSTNILLDDKYRAKVADFGTSRSIAVDQTHLTTRVQGTFGYLDPEYFQSCQFTEKSDVYSFGVVLVELLTGQKPILSPKSEDEGRSLATLFIMAMEENRLFDILDAQVMKEGPKEEIMGFANLANRCLNLNGRNRPTMKQVAVELEGIRLSHGAPTFQQHYEEVEYAVAELNGSWDTTSTSMGSSANNSLSVDVEPLLSRK